MLALLLILLVLGLAFGVYGGGRGYGYAGWSPLGIILFILVVLFLIGRL